MTDNKNITFLLHNNNSDIDNKNNNNSNENKIMTTEEVNDYKNQLLQSINIDTYNNDDNSNMCELLNVHELEIFYTENYTIKKLTSILQYYGIYKSKMIKDEMIQLLLFYETDPLNTNTVMNRLRLWNNMSELKNDSFLGKYILFDI